MRKFFLLIGSLLLFEVPELRAETMVKVRSPLCGVDAYVQKRSENCGGEVFAVRATEHCGVKTYKTVQHRDCGVVFKQGRDEECGPDRYVAKNDKSCPGEKVKVNVRSVGCGNRYGHKNNCCLSKGYEAGHDGGTPDGNCMKFPACRKSEFGVELWALCRLPKFGEQAVRSCPHESGGVQEYNSCPHPKHGILTYAMCRHEEHGVERYSECELPLSVVREIMKSESANE